MSCIWLAVICMFISQVYSKKAMNSYERYIKALQTQNEELRLAVTKLTSKILQLEGD